MANRGREVAVKVSPERFSDRFELEAHAIAALNHPNICTLHDVGPNYLVMELVDGPALSDRIKQGALPLGEALQIAHQIAEALEAAHDKGVVHRDLKPGNIKRTPEGVVKVLDFGLAKMAESGQREGSSANSPTSLWSKPLAPASSWVLQITWPDRPHEDLPTNPFANRNPKQTEALRLRRRRTRFRPKVRRRLRSPRPVRPSPSQRISTTVWNSCGPRVIPLVRSRS